MQSKLKISLNCFLYAFANRCAMLPKGADMANVEIPELVVMNEMAKLMEQLDKAAAHRVIAWLADYCGVACPEASTEASDTAFAQVEGEESDAPAIEGAPEALAGDAPAEPEPAPAEGTFEGLFATVAPKTVIQKALTAAYWVETNDGKETWRSHDITKCLASIDVKVNALSASLALAEKKEEPLVELMSKSGDSMQARKTFRLTEAGRAFVEGRLA